MKNFILKYWQIIVIVVLAFFLLKSCNGNSVNETKKAKLLKNKFDSLQKLSNTNLDKFHDAEMVLKIVIDSNKSLFKQSKILERKLHQLQNKTSVKPLYVDNVIDCNDTIKSIFEIGLLKDSICNNIISDKNKIIVNSFKIIKTDSIQKSVLLGVVEKKDFAIAVQDQFIENQKKQVKKESRKKTIWQTVAGIVSIFAMIK
jgi:hypothetical protein